MPTGNWGSTDLGGTVGLLHASVPLRAAYWTASPGGPGTVVLVQGRAEFMEVYGETIGDLLARGYAVIAFDLRGQGGSQRRTPRGGHVDRFEDYVADLAAIVRFANQVGLPRPYHLLGHSLGGLVALAAAPQLAREVERMVLTAPLIEVAGLPAPAGLLSVVADLGWGVGLSRRLVGEPTSGNQRQFAGNRITSDPARYEAVRQLVDDNPDLVTGPPTLGWVRSAFRAMRQVRRSAGKPLPIPTLFVASGNDTVVSTPAIDAFARATPGGGLVIIPGARHQVLIERDGLRNGFFAAFDAYLEEAVRRLPDDRQPRFARTLRFEAGAAPARPRPAPLPAIEDAEIVDDEPAAAATLPPPPPPPPGEDRAPAAPSPARPGKVGEADAGGAPAASAVAVAFAEKAPATTANGDGAETVADAAAPVPAGRPPATADAAATETPAPEPDPPASPGPPEREESPAERPGSAGAGPNDSHADGAAPEGGTEPVPATRPEAATTASVAPPATGAAPTAPAQRADGGRLHEAAAQAAPDGTDAPVADRPAAAPARSGRASRIRERLQRRAARARGAATPPNAAGPDAQPAADAPSPAPPQDAARGEAEAPASPSPSVEGPQTIVTGRLTRPLVASAPPHGAAQAPARPPAAAAPTGEAPVPPFREADAGPASTAPPKGQPMTPPQPAVAPVGAASPPPQPSADDGDGDGTRPAAPGAADAADHAAAAERRRAAEQPQGSAPAGTAPPVTPPAAADAPTSGRTEPPAAAAPAEQDAGNGAERPTEEAEAWASAPEGWASAPEGAPASPGANGWTEPGPDAIGSYAAGIFVDEDYPAFAGEVSDALAETAAPAPDSPSPVPLAADTGGDGERDGRTEAPARDAAGAAATAPEEPGSPAPAPEEEEAGKEQRRGFLGLSPARAAGKEPREGKRGRGRRGLFGRG